MKARAGACRIGNFTGLLRDWRLCQATRRLADFRPKAWARRRADEEATDTGTDFDTDSNTDFDSDTDTETDYGTISDTDSATVSDSLHCLLRHLLRHLLSHCRRSSSGPRGVIVVSGTLGPGAAADGTGCLGGTGKL